MDFSDWAIGVNRRPGQDAEDHFITVKRDGREYSTSFCVTGEERCVDSTLVVSRIATSIGLVKHWLKKDGLDR